MDSQLGDGGSSNGKEYDEEMNSCSIKIPEDETAKLLPRSSSTDNMQSQKPKYFSMVPEIMRKNKTISHYYDPSVVSIGPYHHGKPELDSAEKLKAVVLDKFISQTSGKSYAELYDKVFKLKDYVRSCYIQGSTDKYNDKELTEMMILDGCFIIDYIDRTGSDVLLESKGYGGMIMVDTDIFLLENQMPFRILQELMNFKYENHQGEKIFKAYMKYLASGVDHDPAGEEWTEAEATRLPRHLLEFLHRSLVYGNAERYHDDDDDDDDVKSSEETEPAAESFWEVFREKVSRPLPILHSAWNAKHQETMAIQENVWMQSCYSVTDLKAKGIHFRPSSVFYMQDIEFISYWFYGVLKLPLLFVHVDTNIFYLNMIAYELCPDTINCHLEFTSYVMFINSLIQGPEDVRELRLKNILVVSSGSSDDEVAKMFKQIATLTYSLQNFDYYIDLKQGIRRHYNSHTKTWMADLIHKYFNSPWTFLAFLAATFVIVLSFLQTYFTIWPRAKTN